jgi:hypothetical protein
MSMILTRKKKVTCSLCLVIPMFLDGVDPPLLIQKLCEHCFGMQSILLEPCWIPGSFCRRKLLQTCQITTEEIGRFSSIPRVYWLSKICTLHCTYINMYCAGAVTMPARYEFSSYCVILDTPSEPCTLVMLVWRGGAIPQARAGVRP